MEDKKGVAALIVSKMGKPHGEPDEDDMDGKAACAEDMMAAMRAGDSKAFMAALDAYLEHR